MSHSVTRSLILFAFSAGAIGNAISQSGGSLDRYFPVRVGESRTYSVSREWTDGSGPNLVNKHSRSSYTETTVGKQVVNGGLEFFEIRRTPGASIHALCSGDPWEASSRAPDETEDTRYRLAVDHSRIYVVCDSKELEEMKSSAKKDEYADFVFPLRLGSAWGADAATLKRKDHMYQWIVAKSLQTMTAGGHLYSNCYEVDFRTLPDDEKRWLCDGVGLVATEYTHHGTMNHYRVELTQIK